MGVLDIRILFVRSACSSRQHAMSISLTWTGLLNLLKLCLSTVDILVLKIVSSDTLLLSLCIWHAFLSLAPMVGALAVEILIGDNGLWSPQLC